MFTSAERGWWNFKPLPRRPWRVDKGGWRGGVSLYTRGHCHCDLNSNKWKLLKAMSIYVQNSLGHPWLIGLCKLKSVVHFNNQSQLLQSFQRWAKFRRILCSRYKWRAVPARSVAPFSMQMRIIKIANSLRIRKISPFQSRRRYGFGPF